MTGLCIMTPDPADQSYLGLWPGVRDRVSAPLLAEGFTVETSPWTEHVTDVSALLDFDLVLPIIAWGYHRDHDRWLAACHTWSEAGLPIANPASVLAWNSDKSYLARLAERGVSIPPTSYVDQVTPQLVDTALEQFGAPVIVKPTVSGGAWRTLKLSSAADLTDAPVGAAMIQPYMPAIESGELSLLFFGGRLSHAVFKRPVAGEFRIQTQYGGLYESVSQPPQAALALAQATLAAIEEPLLYARIDMIEDPDRGWLLMEAELIEPDFYLGEAPDKGAVFAKAVRDRLAKS